MKKKVHEYTDAEELRALMVNAKRIGREDVWMQALSRLAEVEGAKQETPLEREFSATLIAYEELLTVKNGKTTRANRTKQKLKSKGLVQCLEDWALSKQPTSGFDILVKNGLKHLTGEYLVVKYADKFSSRAVESARRRLELEGGN